MDVIDLPLGQIIPYARNPRRNEKAVATVAASIREFGWRQFTGGAAILDGDGRSYDEISREREAA